MSTEADMTQLFAEYETLVAETRDKDGDLDWDKLQGALTTSGAWTTVGAQDLVSVVRDHGAFVLRNAFALAVASEVKDGSLGL